MSKELLKAAKEGDLNKVMKILLDKTIDVNFIDDEDDSDDHHCTALMLAAKYGHFDLVVYLWEQNPGRSTEGCLSQAITHGKMEIVRYLLEDANPKAFINIKSESHSQSLGKYKIVTSLDGVFFDAVNSKSVQVLDYFCKKYPSEVYKIAFNMANRQMNGFNLLHLAAYYNRPDNIQYLLNNYKFDINERASDNHNSTPLMVAAKNGNLECVKVLLESKQTNDISILSGDDIFKGSLLHLTLLGLNIHESELRRSEIPNKAKEYLEIIKIFSEKYPELLKMREREGLTPIQYSIVFRSLDATKYFFSIYPSSEYLYFANYFNADPIIEWLLEEGAYIDDKYHSYPHFRNSYMRKIPYKPSQMLTIKEWSQTKLHKADGFETTLIACFLDSAYKLFDFAEMNEQEVEANRHYFPKKENVGRGVNGRRHIDDNTALHIALSKSRVNIELVIFLIDADANLLLPNKAGKTCLELLLAKNEPILKALGYFFTANKLFKILSKHEDFTQKLNKYALDEDEDLEKLDQETHEINSLTSPIKSQEASQKVYTTLLKCMRRAFEESYKIENPNDRNYFCFLMGSTLAECIPNGHAAFPMEAFQLLDQIDKSSENFIKAKQIQYKLIVSGQIEFKKDVETSNLALIENNDDHFQQNQRLKLLIQCILLGQIKDAPLSQYLSEYLIDSNDSIKGIPDFIDFEKPESCIALIEKMHSENLKLKAEIKERDKLLKKQENIISDKDELIRKLQLELSVYKSKNESQIHKTNESLTLQFNNELDKMKESLNVFSEKSSEATKSNLSKGE